jgi:hypothetical protein
MKLTTVPLVCKSLLVQMAVAQLKKSYLVAVKTEYLSD